MPNKHAEESGRMFEGHLLENETYVGGHVEALEAGIFRSDLPMEYNLDPKAFSQLERELFPGKTPFDPSRSFHELKRNEQDALIKKRVEDYSKKVYAKKQLTKVVSKESIVCQRENPFYIDTVRNFRDRRYEYKSLLKIWKKKADEASASKDVAALDEAKKLTVVYDSLQMAHKCILNSFYGYVMRKGARWYSLEMAGIVCLTGSKIIQLARSRVERIGRPLELDTDGIWCTLPHSFPENFSFTLKSGKSFPISYPCVMLNHLVHAEFTNDQFQTLVDEKNHRYEIHRENSIFFEVDGPYRAMILPSSTEADKLLKKRYAVFNYDGTLAEMKGFELKRRGELRLIKNFQEAIFHVFLQGDTLVTCYEAVAGVANQWLDVLYSKGSELDDNELFELISENRSMSKSLEDYGVQRSTSISTAKRLAEFLGEEMVKDKGLNCKFIISARPHGLTVSDRAIPVAIFSAEESVKRFFLRKWLKDSSLSHFDIRDILDWDYYIERFASVIQKLITIPAAMQHVDNPIPRVTHPEWLKKRVAQKNDKFRQYRITDLFQAKASVINDDARENAASAEDNSADETRSVGEEPELEDLEDFANPVAEPRENFASSRGIKRVFRSLNIREGIAEVNPIDPETDYAGWLLYQKKKWRRRRNEVKDADADIGRNDAQAFFRKQTKTLLTQRWQIIQIAATDAPGEFTVWALIGDSLYSSKLSVPKSFYINSRVQDVDLGDIEGATFERCYRVLPRSHTCMNLFQFSMSETVFQMNSDAFTKVFNHQDTEGVYETNVPSLFRALLSLGCSARVVRKRAASGRGLELGFTVSDFVNEPGDRASYLKDVNLNCLYLYSAGKAGKQVFGLFSSASGTCSAHFVVANLNLDGIPNVARIYAEKVGARMGNNISQDSVDFKSLGFSYSVDIDAASSVHETELDAIQALNDELREYQLARKGPTIIILQSPKSPEDYKTKGLQALSEFPVVVLSSHEKDAALPSLAWQLAGTRRMMAHFLNVNSCLQERLSVARYSDVPIGNFENDYPVYLSDLCFGRHLLRADYILWFSDSEKPDLGGREQDDNRHESGSFEEAEVNNAGTFTNVCVEIELHNLAFNAVLQAGLLHDLEGGASIGVDTSFAFVDGQAVTRNEDDGATADATETSILTLIDERRLNPKVFKLLREIIQSWHYDLLRVHPLACLGSEIIYGTFERLILSTCKRTLNNAIHYSAFVAKDISKKPLFLQLNINVKTFWDYLIWMDPYNYGGVLCENPSACANAAKEVVIDGEHFTLDMRWNIMDYFPPALQGEDDTFV
ncbi:DNA polymerase epsilon catalytic subunit [Irineochytrium annulatum]|nr:DNA polymerase epsilon catalytic subunit [Irineochytrium annulatum]